MATPTRLVSTLDHLYQALSSPLGIVLQALDGDRDYWRNQLYKARAASGDPALACLQVRFSPVAENEIWLVRTNNGVKEENG